MCAKKTRPPRLKGTPPKDETHLWHTEKESVTPLKARVRVLPDLPNVPTRTFYLSTNTFETCPELPQGAPMRHVKSPRITPQARLDLHGMTQKQAFEEVHLFITRCARQGLREVLIITGKGLKGAPTPGVLRASLPTWLEDPLLRPMVGSFSQARILHGGSGAYYVFLKKIKNV